MRELSELREQLASSVEPVTAARIAEAVRSSRLALGSGTTQQVIRTLRDELVGLGPLQKYVDEPTTTDVMVSANGALWTDGATGLHLREHSIGTEGQIRALARRLVTLSGGRLDEGHPYSDGKIGNCRIHAVIPPISVEGTLISLRVSRAKTLTLEQLSENWIAPQVWLPVLEKIVERHINYIVSGATGSGKTTLLAAMLQHCHDAERIVVVEDTTEIQTNHPHLVHLQARAGNVEGAGAVSIENLVRETLRMRPDRLIVGECRGAELREFLTAMNTGHQGAAGTMHANSPEAVPARLIAMGALAGMSPQTVSLQAAAALDVVLHVERRAGVRMPVALSLCSYRQGQLEMIPALVSRAESCEYGPGWGQLKNLLGLASEPV